ncbi:MAG: hypothetical protein HZA54_06080, partial [Planctomycetes bacterium]|nr:hypothetical protein [Planctomycetota bacterium]
MSLSAAAPPLRALRSRARFRAAAGAAALAFLAALALPHRALAADPPAADPSPL